MRGVWGAAGDKQLFLEEDRQSLGWRSWGPTFTMNASTAILSLASCTLLLDGSFLWTTCI